MRKRRPTYLPIPSEETNTNESLDQVSDEPSDQRRTSKMLDKALVKDFRTKKRRAMMKSLFLPLYVFIVDGFTFGGGAILMSKMAKDECSNDTGTGISFVIVISIIRENFTLFSRTLYYFLLPAIVRKRTALMNQKLKRI